LRKSAWIVSLLIFVLCSNASAHNTDSVFSALLQAIKQKDIYQDKKESRIADVKKVLQLPGITDLQRYEIYNRLQREYSAYRVDSSVYYLELNLEIANKLQNIEFLYDTKLNLSYSYWIRGQFFESLNTLESLDRNRFDEMPDWLLINYYESYKRIYLYYSSWEKDSNNPYYRKIALYRDSLLSIVPHDSQSFLVLQAEKLFESGQNTEAIAILANAMAKPIADDDETGYFTGRVLSQIQSDGHEKAIIANITAQIYGKEQNLEMQKYFYAMSAIYDIQSAVKENASMMALALLLYEEGDIDKAYTFIRSSMDDAIFCNARFRVYELSKIFPIIDAAYQEKMGKQQFQLKNYLTLVSILSVFLIGAIIYVYRQMKRIALIRKELYQTNLQLNQLNEELKYSNGQLSTVNIRLTEINKVKEAYLGKFIDLCSRYIEKLDDYRRNLNRIANRGKIEDLLKALKSTDFINDELSDFYTNFDETFLRIYPSFIDDFNALFPEEERQSPKQNEVLNTELRIYALIRLGISDSSKIAVFLRCSITTIYTYRSKLKRKSLFPNNLEEKIMSIGA
jgi:hypothetical protein